MRILSPGKIKQDLYVTLTCSACHCRFECQISEMEHLVDYQPTDCYVINCPEPKCKKQCLLQAEDLPNVAHARPA